MCYLKAKSSRFITLMFLHNCLFKPRLYNSIFHYHVSQKIGTKLLYLFLWSRYFRLCDFYDEWWEKFSYLCRQWLLWVTMASCDPSIAFGAHVNSAGFWTHFLSVSLWTNLNCVHNNAILVKRGLGAGGCFTFCIRWNWTLFSLVFCICLRLYISAWNAHTCAFGDTGVTFDWGCKLLFNDFRASGKIFDFSLFDFDYSLSFFHVGQA